tara:strand:- start:7275 stop:7688 length:414 start_codon:yes stop_codon:yes gene_type:complete
MPIEFDIDGDIFTAQLFEKEAPKSTNAFRSLLPLESKLFHVRWSGFAVWIDIDDIDLPSLPRENHTVYPSVGDILLYPGFRSVKEILLSCGPTCFKSTAGELAGNHIATLDASRKELMELELSSLEHGAKPVSIREV